MTDGQDLIGETRSIVHKKMCGSQILFEYNFQSGRTSKEKFPCWYRDKARVQRYNSAPIKP
jgi:hypothetical protein